MSKPCVKSWKDCTDSKKVVSHAKSTGLDVVEAKGSHFKIRHGSDTMTAYRGTISTGVAVKIWKFFLKVGVVTLILYYTLSTVV